MAVHGVDLSENNGAVDFAALEAAGVEFVLLRCGYGNDLAEQDDKRFFENVRKARDYGLPWGAYLYSYAMTAGEAESEAAHALRLLGQAGKPPYGVWFDMEDADGYKAARGMPSNGDLVEFCRIFCQRMEAAGYYAGVYASASWFTHQLNSPKLDPYDKWVAHWAAQCGYQGSYGIWQHTDRWVIGGKAFDGNWAYKDYPALTGTADKEESAMTEAQVRALAREEIQAYFRERDALPPSDWAQGDLARSREEGILLGDKDGGLRPRAFLTREEAAALANRILDAR